MAKLYPNGYELQGAPEAQYILQNTEVRHAHRHHPFILCVGRYSWGTADKSPNLPGLSKDAMGRQNAKSPVVTGLSRGNWGLYGTL